MKKKLLVFACIGLGIGLSYSHAQCAGFTKRKCLPALSPYLSNGQMHHTVLESGDKARVNLTLNKGLSYRIAVCTEKKLIGASYSLENSRGKVFKQDQLESTNSLTDLRVNQTGQYLLNIRIPESKNANQKACVSVLIGFKE